MINKDRVLDLASRRCAIKHIKRNSTYHFIGPSKGKVNGEWVYGATYVADMDFAMYWRPVDKFDGFEEL